MPNFNTQFEKFDWLDAAYKNNGLYDTVRKYGINNATWIEALKPLRTVVNRSVEFYVAKIYPSTDVSISAENQEIIDYIEQVTKWSNFSGKKQLYLRYLALYGELFLKVNVENDKVYYEAVSPQYVTDFTVDSRGYLTSIRLDIPIVVDDKNYTYTEFWNKEYFSVWIHKFDRNTDLSQLGDAKDFGYTAELGINFVPFVHIKFRDIGEKRGIACVEHTIDKITEANRQATRLSQMLFRHNKALWVVSANSVDSSGIALPAPRISTGTGDAATLADDSIIYLPGASKLDSLIPNINYGDALNVLRDMMNELEQDLPELKYYSLKDGNLSGKAISLLLGGAYDRAKEARDNFIQGMERINEMALTMGTMMNIFPSQLGTYENGDFNHSIMVESFFTTDLDDRVTILKALVDAGVSLEEALRLAGIELGED